MPSIGIDASLALGRADLRLRRHTGPGTPAEPAERAQQEIADHEDHDAAQAEAAGDQWQQAAEPAAAKAAAAEPAATAAAVVDPVAAFPFVAKAHAALLSARPNA